MNITTVCAQCNKYIIYIYCSFLYFFYLFSYRTNRGRQREDPLPNHYWCFLWRDICDYCDERFSDSLLQPSQKGEASIYQEVGIPNATDDNQEIATSKDAGDYQEIGNLNDSPLYQQIGFFKKGREK